MEGLGSSGKLVGIISTCPGTSPTPWCRIMDPQRSTKERVGIDLFPDNFIQECPFSSFSPLGEGLGTLSTSNMDSAQKLGPRDGLQILKSKVQVQM